MNRTRSYVWHNGKLDSWEGAKVHLDSESVVHGASVFEGVRAWWDPELAAHRVVALDAHLDRLGESCRLLRIAPPDGTLSELRGGLLTLLGSATAGRDCYLRMGVYLDCEPDIVGSYALVRVEPPADLAPLRLATSDWRRIPEDCLPSQAKAAIAYQALRLARLDARDRGADEVVLLDHDDTVSETAGAALLVVRDGTLIAPDPGTTALRSITCRIVVELAAELGIPVRSRRVNRAELARADEVMLCGTKLGVTSAGQVDSVALPAAPGPVTLALAQRYEWYCRHAQPAEPWWISVHPVQHQPDRADSARGGADQSVVERDAENLRNLGR